MMVIGGIHHIRLCLLEAQRLKNSSPIPPILFGSREYLKEQFPIPQKVSYCNITVGTSNLKETELGSHNNSLSVDKDAPANEGGSIGSQMSRNDKPSSPSPGRSSSAAKPPGPELLKVLCRFPRPKNITSNVYTADPLQQRTPQGSFCIIVPKALIGQWQGESAHRFDVESAVIDVIIEPSDMKKTFSTSRVAGINNNAIIDKNVHAVILVSLARWEQADPHKILDLPGDILHTLLQWKTS